MLPYFKAFQRPGTKLFEKAFKQTFPNDFAADVKSGEFPKVSWIIPPLGFDEHPSASPTNGQWFVSMVLDELVSNPKVWAKTALFIMYDENDGWFDHVAPPTAPKGTPGEYLGTKTFPVGESKPDTLGIAGPLGLGVRVPLLVVSPFSRGGHVATEVFDHTSQLKLISERFGVEVPNVSAWRRKTVGDLTSTLFTSKHDASVPKLPKTSIVFAASGPASFTGQWTESGASARASRPSSGCPTSTVARRQPARSSNSMSGTPRSPTRRARRSTSVDLRTRPSSHAGIGCFQPRGNAWAATNRTSILFVVASFTAQTMALQRALERSYPPSRRLIDDPLAVGFLGGGLRAAAQVAAVPLVGRIVPKLYDLVWPGPRPSAVARTRVIDDTVCRLLGGGVRQVVILGAGYDSRAWRLPGLAGCRVIEVDRDDTQRDKLAALRRRRADTGAVVFCSVDFERDDLATVLTAVGYDPTAATLWLWEGVTNYLSAGAVDATLEVVRELSVAGSFLLFTFVHCGVLDGTVSFPKANRWMASVARAGEPWTFGLDPAAIDGFLIDHGLRLCWECSTAEAGRRCFPPAGRSDRASELYRIALASV